MKEGIVAMTKSERRIYQLAMEVTRHKLSIGEFALLVGKSYRQARRIIQRVRRKDALGVFHGNQGREPINKTSEDRWWSRPLRQTGRTNFAYFGTMRTFFWRPPPV